MGVRSAALTGSSRFATKGVLESRVPSATHARRCHCIPPGPVAQLAEQQTLNLRVVGSIPTRLTIDSKGLNDIDHWNHGDYNLLVVSSILTPARSLLAFIRMRVWSS